MGLASSQKTRFSSLFRSNLTLIRLQFRRIFLFMMHPNHKLHTRLQLIKRLLITSNCELIFKCILSDQDAGNVGAASAGSSGRNANIAGQSTNGISFNTKLAFYLDALMDKSNEQLQQVSNNDREILIHLDEMLCQAGLDYKAEMASVIQVFRKTSLSK